VHGARRDPTAERRLAAPRRRVAGRYHVDVRVEQQGRPAVASGEPADDAPRLAPLDLDAGEVRLGEGRVERDLPRVDVHADLGHPGRQQVLDGVLLVGARHAGDPDELGELDDDLRGVVVEVLQDTVSSGRHRGCPLPLRRRHR
jgi:hypothetical protein